ncbi:MAG: hypothetical protein LBP32_03450, partial [Spirochaetaceae bacterium]|nr:hypothetical protein [Spirochaetaceae bacterium]
LSGPFRVFLSLAFINIPRRCYTIFSAAGGLFDSSLSFLKTPDGAMSFVLPPEGFFPRSFPGIDGPPGVRPCRPGSLWALP